jgi:hypothetical protein
MANIDHQDSVLSQMVVALLEKFTRGQVERNVRWTVGINGDDVIFLFGMT